MTSVIKQKNIIRTGLNGLLQSNYCTQWNINVIWWWMWWISSQWSKYWFWSYWDGFENMVEIVNMSQWKCALTMTAMVKHLLKLNPSKFQKVTKYALFYSSVIVLKILRFLSFYFAIAAVRDSPVLDISKDTNIMIDETFMHLKASLFDDYTSGQPRAPEGFGLLDTVIIYKWTSFTIR